MGYIDLNKEILPPDKVPIIKRKVKIGSTFQHMKRHEIFDRHRVVEIINAYRVGRKAAKFGKANPYMHMHLRFAWDEGFNSAGGKKYTSTKKGNKKISINKVKKSPKKFSILI